MSNLSNVGSVKKILIVDDEEMLTYTLKGYFQRWEGYTVFTADDGAEAKRIIETQELDLVLLDMKLPKIEGIELLKNLRENYPKTRVIVMTCYDLEYKKKMDAVGYDYFFMKPLSICALQDKIKELLSEEVCLQVKERTSLPERKDKSEDAVDKEAVPKARILIIEPRKNIASLLKDFFEEIAVSGGDYEVLTMSVPNWDRIKQFKSNIVLYDIVQIGVFGEFATSLMGLDMPPQEIILFGDPHLKWEEVDVLVERGMSYVQTPLEAISGYLGEDFKLPSKETVEKLAKTVRSVCLKYKLVRKGKVDDK